MGDLKTGDGYTLMDGGLIRTRPGESLLVWGSLGFRSWVVTPPRYVFNNWDIVRWIETRLHNEEAC